MQHHRSPSIALSLAMLLSLAGLILSGLLVREHVHLTVGDGSKSKMAQLCEDIAGASCASVLTSDHGTKFGAPTAMWGFVYFAAMSSWFIVVGRPEGPVRKLNLIPMLGALIGAGACGYFAYVMYRVLEGFCLYCAIIHGITGLLFFTSLFLWPRTSYITPEAGEPPVVVAPQLGSGFGGVTELALRYASRRAVFAAILLAAAVSTAGWLEYKRGLAAGFRHKAEAELAEVKPYKDKFFDLSEQQGELLKASELQEQNEELEKLRDEYYAKWQAFNSDYIEKYKDFLAQDIEQIVIDDDDPIRGNPDAPHTIVLYSDVLCPYCKQLEFIVKQQLERYPDDIRVIFKHFPMSTKCNDQLKKNLHPGACEAAWSVEAARVVGGDKAFWGMVDFLFEHAKDFQSNAVATFNTGAKELGLDNAEMFKQIGAIGSGTETQERVLRHVEQGKALGIKGTPRAYFDGRPIKYWGDPHFWRYLISESKSISIGELQTQPATESAPEEDASDVAAEEASPTE